MGIVVKHWNSSSAKEYLIGILPHFMVHSAKDLVPALSLSYIYPISTELWILVLDAYIDIDHLHLSDETIEWMVVRRNDC